MQGHYVPSSSHVPRGPFPPEVLAGPQMEQDLDHADSLHVALDDVKFFKCKDCENILGESELDDHECYD